MGDGACWVSSWEGIEIYKVAPGLQCDLGLLTTMQSTSTLICRKCIGYQVDPASSLVHMHVVVKTTTKQSTRNTGLEEGHVGSVYWTAADAGGGMWAAGDEQAN